MSSGDLHCGHDDLKPVDKVGFLPLPPAPEPVFLIEINNHDCKSGFRVLPPCCGCIRSPINDPVVRKHQVWTPTTPSAKLRL